MIYKAPKSEWTESGRLCLSTSWFTWMVVDKILEQYNSILWDKNLLIKL